jgi:hypothetical protein
MEKGTDRLRKKNPHQQMQVCLIVAACCQQVAI